MKSQAAITEYLVLVIMIVLIAFIAVVLLFGFELLNTGTEQAKSRERRALFTLESFAASTALNGPQYQKGSFFEDARLTAATCGDLENLFGSGWWAEVRVLKDKAYCDSLPVWRRSKCQQDMRREENIVCTKQNYPSCGIWRFCAREEKMIYTSVPVNVYRKINNTVDLGILTVGIPSGG